jgi:hypothetical protein
LPRMAKAGRQKADEVRVAKRLFCQRRATQEARIEHAPVSKPKQFSITDSNLLPRARILVCR